MIELSKQHPTRGWTAGTPSLVGPWFDHTPSRWFDSVVSATAAGASMEIALPDQTITGVSLYYERLENGLPIKLSIDGRDYLEIDTKNSLQFARVNYEFKWLPEAEQSPTVAVAAPKGGPSKAAYLLYTVASNGPEAR